VFWTLLGGALASGGAGAINHYLDRDIDPLMGRTALRPIPAGTMPPQRALIFGIVLGILSFVLFVVFVNLFAAVLAMVGLLGYVFVYTLWLKRSTPSNIVIGGAAGGIPPLVGWAAVDGELKLTALYLFAIIFFWTPPHFWALSLLIADDYARTGVPMLPVVRGAQTTRRQILLYSAVMVAVTVGPVVTGLFGAFYLVCALALGAGFIALAVSLARHPSRPAARRLYLSSLAYLALLFVAMAVDRAL
jgi:protoheme IX farnesyltransferase